MGTVVRPDCADLPYFLRAYFAFKMGLPFGYSKCSRGGGGKPPRCHEWFSIQNSEQARSAPAEPKIASGAPLEMVTRPSPSRPRRRRRSGSGLRRRSAAICACSATASIPGPRARR